LGLHLHFRFWRHVAKAHQGNRWGNCCWCSSDDLFGDVILLVTYFAPVIWPILLAGQIILAFFMPWLRLRNRVKEMATWEGRIENAHPGARPGNGTGRDATSGGTSTRPAAGAL